jgi:hypothetical protein
VSDHAVLSPSKAPRWIPCPGSIVACKGVEDTGSVYADEGTAAHDVAAHRLLDKPGPAAPDVETSDYINVYTRAVRNAAEGKTLMVEQRLDIEKWTGEKGGKGTSDAIIVDLSNASMEVWDLKFGMGHIVDAQDNEQLMLYALGALDLVEIVYGEMKTIKLVICQPRRDHISEHTISREDLIAFGAKSRKQGELALALLAAGHVGDELHPSEKACLFCPVKATCPALLEMIQSQVFDEFEVLSDEVNVKAKDIEGDAVPPEVLDLIEQWVAAKRTWTHDRLRAGISVPGWKLVLGKKGNRKFTNVATVEELLKQLGFKEEIIFEKTLIPLTQIEKIVPKAKWPLFEDLISQSDAQPQAVSAANKKAEYVPQKANVEDFQSTEDNYDAFL